MRQYTLTLGGVTLRCRFRYSETAAYFDAFAPSGAASPCVEAPEPPVSIPDRDWSEALREGMTDDAHSEFSMLTNYCSDALLRYDRVILHAAALRWRDGAYLICAPSGTGKSTQAGALQALRPGEFGVICGDRPVLEFRLSAPCHSERSEESVSPVPAPILVHPSPWNGKENWHGAEAAPLAGLILLSRGPENRLTALTDREAALTMYQHFLQSAWEPENIRRVAALETRLLRAVPIWLLESDQVPDSTRLLLDAVFPAEQPGPSKKAGVP